MCVCVSYNGGPPIIEVMDDREPSMVGAHKVMQSWLMALAPPVQHATCCVAAVWPGRSWRCGKSVNRSDPISMVMSFPGVIFFG